jgi:hypothetical protein
MDIENTLNWVRNKGKDDAGNDLTGEFRKLESMMPKKSVQTTPEDRSREIEGALDWMRSNGACRGQVQQGSISPYLSAYSRTASQGS